MIVTTLQGKYCYLIFQVIKLKVFFGGGGQISAANICILKSLILPEVLLERSERETIFLLSVLIL